MEPDDLRKLKFPESAIIEEMKTHPPGAWFDRGYNLAIDEICFCLEKGIKHPWIDSPENPNNINK